METYNKKVVLNGIYAKAEIKEVADWEIPCTEEATAILYKSLMVI